MTSSGNRKDGEQCLVSVIVPAYNAARFITRTLESASRQTHRRLEIIVVDDGSTDETAELTKSFAGKDERFRVVSTENRGVALARNKGLSLAQGDFVAFLDADDLWHPQKISLQLQKMLSRENCAVVYGWSANIDLNDAVTLMAPRWTVAGRCLNRHLFARVVGNGSTLLVRKAAALSVGGFDPRWAQMGLGGCEDLDFELRLAETYEFDCVEKYVTGYRTYPGNMSSDGRRMGRALVQTIRKSIERNSGLSKQARNWALGSAYHYATNTAIPSRDVKMFADGAGRMLAADPFYFLLFVANDLPKRVSNLIRRLTLGESAPQVPLAAFEHIDDVDVVRMPKRWQTRRLAKLLQDDRSKPEADREITRDRMSERAAS
jgi:glycosyltransferase involved in cell wall biosynthesis